MARHVYTDEEQVAASDEQTPVESASLKTLLFASLNRIKSMMGTNSWMDNPPATLQQVSDHINSRNGHPLATTSEDGFMTSSDKEKLNGLNASYLGTNTFSASSTLDQYPLGLTIFATNNQDTSWPYTTGDIYTQKSALSRATQIITESGGSGKRMMRTASGSTWDAWRSPNDGINTFNGCGIFPHSTNDQSAAIQNAINLTSSLGINHLRVNPGTYVCKNITIPSNFVLEFLPGAKWILSNNAGSVNHCIKIPSNSSNVHVLNAVVDGNRQNQGVLDMDNYHTPRPLFSAGTDIVIRDCSFLNSAYDGMVLWDRSLRVHVENCLADGAFRYGFGVYSTHNFSRLPQDITFQSCTAMNTGVGWNPGGGAGFGSGMGTRETRWFDCVSFDTGGDGIACYGQHNTSLIISNCRFENVGNNGIHSAGEQVTITGTITKNAVNRGITHGYDTETGKYGSGFTCTGNYVENSGDYQAIRVYRHTKSTIVGNTINKCRGEGIQLVDSTDCTVGDNTVVDAGMTNADAIQIDRSPRTTINGNNILKAGRDGIRITGLTRNLNVTNNIVTYSGEYGIRFIDGQNIDTYIVVGNNLTNNVGGNLLTNVGTNKVVDMNLER